MKTQWHQVLAGLDDIQYEGCTSAGPVRRADDSAYAELGVSVGQGQGGIAYAQADGDCPTEFGTAQLDNAGGEKTAAERYVGGDNPPKKTLAWSIDSIWILPLRAASMRLASN